MLSGLLEKSTSTRYLHWLRSLCCDFLCLHSQRNNQMSWGFSLTFMFTQPKNYNYNPRWSKKSVIISKTTLSTLATSLATGICLFALFYFSLTHSTAHLCLQPYSSALHEQGNQICTHFFSMSLSIYTCIRRGWNTDFIQR